MAKVEKINDGELRVTFNVGLGEIVNGQYFCGLGYSPTIVEDAKIGGKVLKFFEMDSVPVYSINDSKVSMSEPLSCSLNGVSFISDTSSTRALGNQLTVRMNKQQSE